MAAGGAADNAVLRAIAAALGGPADLPDVTLYVAYSGGLDSTVLLHAALRLYPGRIVALHVNHGLHVDARVWQRHCAAQCDDWRIAFFSREVSVAAGNMEAAARAARYGYFEEVLGADDVLLMAHHRDDQAETVLLRIAQGRGLLGMPEQRALGRGRLVRPLLKLPRVDLEDYARTRKLSWVEDPSNADIGLDRNYLRARVMPALRARWPQIDAAVEDALAQRLGIDELLLARLDADPASLAVKHLAEVSATAAAELVRVWLHARHAVAPSGPALRSFIAQLDAPPDRQPALDLNVGTLRRYRDRIHHVPDRPRLQASYAVNLPGAVRLPHGLLDVERGVRGAPGFVAQGAVRVVFREGGDGGEGCNDTLLLRGHHRDLNKLLREAGVPPWERGCYPLLADRHGIVAVPGIGYRDTDPPTGSEVWEARWRPTVH